MIAQRQSADIIHLIGEASFLQNDKIFFKKSDIKVGTELIRCGRLDEIPTKWTVKRILHFYNEIPNKRNFWQGRLRHRRVETPETLLDAVVLTCANGAQMELTFQYLSYSAIWRLP